ncbi:helix-turn-helix domain-containing protein [Weissella confusa]|uniref:helix-turn-helix domain-containing protein n=1 Tax=Weissella confusa TaxID=1583 RepID=UPI00223A751C|nr:helix-turn-helix domain-containing protein [Weissella confusa]
MYNQGHSYTDLSAEYGPSVDSIRDWVKLYDTTCEIRVLKNFRSPVPLGAKKTCP